jgi:hypothetical protein
MTRRKTYSSAEITVGGVPMGEAAVSYDGRVVGRALSPPISGSYEVTAEMTLDAKAARDLNMWIENMRFQEAVTAFSTHMPWDAPFAILGLGDVPGVIVVHSFEEMSAEMKERVRNAIYPYLPIYLHLEFFFRPRCLAHEDCRGSFKLAQACLEGSHG